jgi:hypothetical protein
MEEIRLRGKKRKAVVNKNKWKMKKKWGKSHQIYEYIILSFLLGLSERKIFRKTSEYLSDSMYL